MKERKKSVNSNDKKREVLNIYNVSIKHCYIFQSLGIVSFIIVIEQICCEYFT